MKKLLILLLLLPLMAKSNIPTFFGKEISGPKIEFIKHLESFGFTQQASWNPEMIKYNQTLMEGFISGKPCTLILVSLKNKEMAVVGVIYRIEVFSDSELNEFISGLEKKYGTFYNTDNPERMMTKSYVALDIEAENQQFMISYYNIENHQLYLQEYGLKETD